MTRLTDQQVMDLLRSDGPYQRARKAFSAAAARIEQASQQRTPLGSIELRRLEFEAVDAIVAAGELMYSLGDQ